MDIVLGNYKGLKANIPYIAYTEEDVNSQIATLLSGIPVREQKTGPLAMGDTAVIDYEGFKDGVAFEGEIARATGANGGGRPNFAQGGVKDASKLEEVLSKIENELK